MSFSVLIIIFYRVVKIVVVRKNILETCKKWILSKNYVVAKKRLFKIMIVKAYTLFIR